MQLTNTCVACEYADKLYFSRNVIVLTDTENRTIISSFVWTKHQNVTVTDGQSESSSYGAL